MPQKSFFKITIYSFIFYYLIYFNYSLNVIFFDYYKYFIYNLNDLLLNLLFFFYLFIFIFLISHMWFKFFYCYFAYFALYFYKNLYFFFDYILCYKFLTIPPTLLNGLVWAHPPIFYCGLVLVIYTKNYYLYNFFFFKIKWLFYTLFLSFILGGLWSITLFTWGFYWVYDYIEFLPLLVLSAVILFLHKEQVLFLPHLFFFKFCLFVVFLLSLRYGFFLTKHSFFSRTTNFFLSANTFHIVITFFISQKILYFKSNYLIAKNFFYLIFYFFIFTKNFLILYLLNVYICIIVWNCLNFKIKNLYEHIIFLFFYFFTLFFMHNYVYYIFFSEYFFSQNIFFKLYAPALFLNFFFIINNPNVVINVLFVKFFSKAFVLPKITLLSKFFIKQYFIDFYLYYILLLLIFLLKINKKLLFKSFTAYFNYYGYLKKTRLLTVFKPNTEQNLFCYRKRYQRLVFVRSPKHFNIGKHQFFYIRTSFQIRKNINLISYSGANLYQFCFTNFTTIIPQLPNAKLKHLKVIFTQKVTIIL